MNKPPFHPFTEKKLKDRVKISKLPLDESKGFFFGSVVAIGIRTQYTNRGIRIAWDLPVPFWGNDEFNVVPSENVLMA